MDSQLAAENVLTVFAVMFPLVGMFLLLVLGVAWRKENLRRVAGYAPASRRFLRKRRVDSARIKHLFADQTSEDILKAVHCPDHSEESRVHLGNLLRQQGWSDKDIDEWSYSQDELMVEGFQTNRRDATAAINIRKPRFFYASLLLLPASSTLALLLHWLINGEVDNDKFEASIGFLFVGGFLWVPFSSLIWRAPLRVTVLRPFGQKHIARPLQMFVYRHLSGFGHVFTLQDANIRLPPSRLVGVLVSPFLGLLLQGQIIKNERAFIRFRNAMSHLYRQNMRWVVWPYKLFVAKCVDSWWKRCVELLLVSSDVIVMETSHIGPGSLWELQTIAKKGFEKKTIFISAQSDIDRAKLELCNAAVFTETPTIYVYGTNGKLVVPREFEGAFASALSADRNPKGSAATCRNSRRVLRLLELTMVVTLCSWLVLAIAIG